MMKLDYRIDPGDRSSDHDLAAASIAELHYDLFFGDIILRAGDWDASAEGEGVPVVDFALRLRVHLEVLLEDPIASTTLVFAYTDDKIFFQRVGDVVELSANYAGGAALVPLSELRTAVDAYARRVLTELATAYPALAKNPAIVHELRSLT